MLKTLLGVVDGNSFFDGKMDERLSLILCRFREQRGVMHFFQCIIEQARPDGSLIDVRKGVQEVPGTVGLGD
jgi:hypothetical protein